MANMINVNANVNPVVVVSSTIGIQGPPGPAGIDGTPGIDGGNCTVSETAPLTAAPGDIWYNPTTLVVHFYANSQWQNQALDGLNF